MVGRGILLPAAGVTQTHPSSGRRFTPMAELKAVLPLLLVGGALVLIGLALIAISKR